MTYAQQEPACATYAFQEPMRATYAQQEPVRVTYAQQEPAHAMYTQQEPVCVTYARQEPVSTRSVTYAQQEPIYTETSEVDATGMYSCRDAVKPPSNESPRSSETARASITWHWWDAGPEAYCLDMPMYGERGQQAARPTQAPAHIEARRDSERRASDTPLEARRDLERRASDTPQEARRDLERRASDAPQEAYCLDMTMYGERGRQAVRPTQAQIDSERSSDTPPEAWRDSERRYSEILKKASHRDSRSDGLHFGPSTSPVGHAVFQAKPLGSRSPDTVVSFASLSAKNPLPLPIDIKSKEDNFAPPTVSHAEDQHNDVESSDGNTDAEATPNETTPTDTTPRKPHKKKNKKKKKKAHAQASLEEGDGPHGLTFMSLPSGSVIIQTVAPNSWAGDIGVKPGYEIVKIDGEPVAKMPAEMFEDRLNGARPLSLEFARAQLTDEARDKIEQPSALGAAATLRNRVGQLQQVRPIFPGQNGSALSPYSSKVPESIQDQRKPAYDDGWEDDETDSDDDTGDPPPASAASLQRRSATFLFKDPALEALLGTASVQHAPSRQP